MVDSSIILVVERIILESEGALGIRDILDILRQRDIHYDDTEVREAIWVLIDQGKVDLTPDRKLVRVKQLHSSFGL